MDKWFKTWNRLEYKEWATPIKRGYLLVIIRKEKDNYLCVKAKLLMREKGLPGFEVIEEQYVLTNQKANKQIRKWKIGL